MRATGVALSLVVTLAVSAAEPVHPGPAGNPAREPWALLNVPEVDGSTLDLGALRVSRLWVVALTSAETADETTAALSQLDERLLNDPWVETLLLVDVRRFDNFLARPLVEARLRAGAKKARADRRLRRTRAGVDASESWLRRFHLAADFDGSLLKTARLTPGRNGPVFVVLDPAGSCRGPFRGPASETVASVLETLRLARLALPATPWAAGATAAPAVIEP